MKRVLKMFTLKTPLVEKKEPEKEVIDPEAILWVSNLLKNMGIPDSEKITVEDLLSIKDAEVEACFEEVYGKKNEFNLSRLEKRCLYIIHKRSSK